jgi:hypothetical protein
MCSYWWIGVCRIIATCRLKRQVDRTTHERKAKCGCERFCYSARTLHLRAVLLTRHVCALASRARSPNQSQMKPPVGNTQQGTKTRGEGQRPRLKDEATTTRVVGPTLACEPSTFHSTPARTRAHFSSTWPALGKQFLCAVRVGTHHKVGRSRML